MKKIGLISYHSGYNYGTMLQAFALQYIIRKLGFDSVEYINYVDGPKFEDANWSIRLKKIKNKFALGLPQLLFLLFYRKSIKRTASKFDSFFSSYIKVSDRFYSSVNELKTNPPSYDVYIVGSDQTWNPTFLQDNSAYFLSFVNNHSSKNSYGSSLGVYSLDDRTKSLYVNYLNSFNHISCREEANALLLSSLLHRHVEYVLDPTLLVSKEEWACFENNYGIKGGYVLCYSLGVKDNIRKFAEKLAKSHNLPVYYIVSNYKDTLYPNALFGVGPLDFLYLIRNATYVCTDSFHGTIFSLNFRKNFYSFYKREGDEKVGDNSRIYLILKEFNLLSRLKGDAFSEEEDINYDRLAPCLEERKEHSLVYLNQVLQ